MDIHLPENLEHFVRDQVRSGRFPSVDHVVREALEHFRNAEIPPPAPIANANAAPNEQRAEAQSGDQRPLWEIITEIARRVPDEDWARLPPDASYQLDHYLYGSPKKP